MDKTQLRRQMREMLKSLTEERVRALSDAACSRVMAHPAFFSADTVFLYAAMPNEADPSALASKAASMGKRVAYPYCVNSTQIVAMQPIVPNDLEPGAYGIYAPVPERSIVIPPQEIDFVLVSGLAFDTQGGRLGRGAGYYDRFLSRTAAFRAAFCFELQVLDEVPMDEHDLFMNAVFTDTALYTPHL